LFDSGSGSQIVSRKFVEGLQIPTVQMSNCIRLRYGDGVTAYTTTETVPLKISIQGVIFMEKFIVTPYDTPSVDLIFGLSFQNRVRFEIRYSDKAGENEPYILFPTGERIYTEKWLEGDIADIRFVDAENAHKWMLKEMKLNGDTTDIEIYVVSVQKEMEINGLLPTEEKTKKPVPPEIQKLLDKYDLLRTGVPIHEIRTRPKKATSVHRIDLKEGARPLKLRRTYSYECTNT
jgi:hypothetical protein